jgi:hypothetical protein
MEVQKILSPNTVHLLKVTFSVPHLKSQCDPAACFGPHYALLLLTVQGEVLIRVGSFTIL